jgi:hypothetical protein
MILAALDDAGGQRYLAEQAQKNPAAFMSLLAKILPSNANVNLSGEPTTEELIAIVMADPELRARLAAGAEPSARGLH